MTLDRVSRSDAARLGLAFLALCAWDALGLDLDISRLFGDASGFSWRDHWLVGGILHANARWVAWTFCLGLLANVWRIDPKRIVATLPE